MMDFIDRDKYGYKSGIYGIINTKNKKIYIGQTRQPFYKRYQLHDWKLRDGSHDNQYLQNAYNKYGEEKFKFIVVEVVEDISDEILNQKEIYYIDQYKKQGLSYNILLGGGGRIGTPMSDHAKRIIGEKNRINMTGKKMSEETKKKMSVSRVGKLCYKKSTILDVKIASKIKELLMTNMKPFNIAKELNVDYKIVNSILSNNSWVTAKVDGWDEWRKSRKTYSRLTKEQVNEICRLYSKEQRTVDYLVEKFDKPLNSINSLLYRHGLINEF